MYELEDSLEDKLNALTGNKGSVMKMVATTFREGREGNKGSVIKMVATTLIMDQDSPLPFK